LNWLFHLRLFPFRLYQSTTCPFVLHFIPLRKIFSSFPPFSLCVCLASSLPCTGTISLLSPLVFEELLRDESRLLNRITPFVALRPLALIVLPTRRSSPRPPMIPPHTLWVASLGPFPLGVPLSSFLMESALLSGQNVGVPSPSSQTTLPRCWALSHCTSVVCGPFFRPPPDKNQFPVFSACLPAFALSSPPLCMARTLTFFSKKMSLNQPHVLVPQALLPCPLFPGAFYNVFFRTVLASPPPICVDAFRMLGLPSLGHCLWLSDPKPPFPRSESPSPFPGRRVLFCCWSPIIPLSDLHSLTLSSPAGPRVLTDVFFPFPQMRGFLV